MHKLRKYWRHPLPYFIAAAITIFYIYLPSIAQEIVLNPNYRNYAHGDANNIVNFIQKRLVFPFGNILDYGPRSFLVFPYWVLVIILFRAIYIQSRKFWKVVGGALILIIFTIWLFPNLLLKFENNKASQSSGKVASGRIMHSKRMNYQGDNFTTYSFLCYLIGRTYVHEKVRQTMLDAYGICKETTPNKTFVIGEIGLQKGGRFLPHRTHQNGLSVDFMTPLLKNGKPYQSNHPFNLWGYGINFDEKGRQGNVQIDYETMAAHLLALKKAAKKNGLIIEKVIFDPVLQPYVKQSSLEEQIKGLPFTKNRVVIRHDDHYHVDFGLGK